MVLATGAFVTGLVTAGVGFLMGAGLLLTTGFRFTSFSFPLTAPFTTALFDLGTAPPLALVFDEVLLVLPSLLLPALPLEEVLSLDDLGLFSAKTTLVGFGRCSCLGFCFVVTAVVVLMVFAVIRVVPVAAVVFVNSDCAWIAVPSWNPPGIFPNPIAVCLGLVNKSCARGPVPNKPGNEGIAKVGAMAGDRPMFMILERGDNEPGLPPMCNGASSISSGSSVAASSTATVWALTTTSSSSSSSSAITAGR
jgi:hypothetical protein